MPFVFECVASISPPQVLALQGTTLPFALMGQPYSASIIAQASGGFAPLSFGQTGAAGPGAFNTSVPGLVTGTPAVSNERVTSDGSYRITDQGDVRITT